MPRDMQKQIRYVDQYDGPSSLIIQSAASNQHDTDHSKIKTFGETNIFDEERKTFYSTFGTKKFFDMSPSKKSQQVESVITRSPLKQYEEFDSLRQSMKEFHDLKVEKQFLNKRDRLFKNTWRHGILGVDNPDSPTSGIYKKISIERNKQQAIKERREKVRQKVLVE
jgi:hypothetical protein